MITAIETRYAGCRFRSRLEARWAVFLDALRIQWQYEPEGFELPSGWYLPDFFLPEADAWMEIKGQRPTETEKTKLIELAWEVAGRGQKVRALIGDIPRGTERKTFSTPFGKAETAEIPGVPCLIPVPGIIFPQETTPGRIANRIEDYQKVSIEHWILLDSLWLPGASYEEIDPALAIARSARFEHGEAPQVPPLSEFDTVANPHRAGCNGETQMFTCPCGDCAFVCCDECGNGVPVARPGTEPCEHFRSFGERE